MRKDPFRVFGSRHIDWEFTGKQPGAICLKYRGDNLDLDFHGTHNSFECPLPLGNVRQKPGALCLKVLTCQTIDWKLCSLKDSRQLWIKIMNCFWLEVIVTEVPDESSKLRNNQCHQKLWSSFTKSFAMHPTVWTYCVKTSCNWIQVKTLRLRVWER